jgi:tRNA/tmRNA/rRNA uracil-C5-methylase (TrmA/RlmC/RlmD family)
MEQHTGFAELLRRRIDQAAIAPRRLEPGECRTTGGKQCRLCHASRLSYADELPLKVQALGEFWAGICPEGPTLAPLRPSPRGRGYRSVSKRKVFLDGRRRFLGLIDPDSQRTGGGLEVAICAIEPEIHLKIFSACAGQLNRPHTKTLASCLRYVIVRGGVQAPAVILSVEEISPVVVREANGLSRALTRAVPSITGVFLFEDTSDGRYYLGAGAAPSAHVFRKLFGARELSATIAGIRFAFHPLAFSQVNAEGAGILVRTAEELLRPSKDQRLLDLYCGYGLFGLSLAPLVRQVTGIESSPHSVAAAIAIARARGVRHARFFRDGVSAGSLSRHAGAPGPLDLVVLDPPRGGTENGVIEAVAERRPVRALHIFCNTEVIARELARWKENGYAVSAAVPVDMFPGTATVEILTLLEKRG